MSMTKEEAIKYGENKLTLLGALGYNDYYTPGEYCGYYDEFSFVTVALSALRPITREQVEKVWGSRGWETVPDKDFVDTAGRQVYHLHCPHCGFFWRETGHAKYFRFCPACGAPMTDEAVDMVMERLEALRDE